LWPLLHHQTVPLRDTAGNLVYRVNIAKDGEVPEYRVLAAADVLHVKLGGFTSLTGVSVIEAAKNTIGLSIAATKSASRIFSNGSVPPLALINKSPMEMAPAAKTKAREDWETLMANGNAHRIAILDSDFEIQKLGYSQEESQWLQTRQLSMEAICGLFRVPSHMLNAGTAKVTNSNMQEQNALFFGDCLKSYCVRIAAEYTHKLLSDADKVAYEFDWDTSEMLMPDYASKASYYTAAINGGWLSRAEVRFDFALDPVDGEGLSKYTVPVNQMASSLLLSTEPTLVAPDGSAQPDADELNAPGPGGNDAQPALRRALRNYGPSYSRLIVDAIRRVTSGESSTRAFGPIVESIADSAAQAADVETNAQRMSDYPTKLESRSTKWTVDQAETIAADELRKVVKHFVFGSFEDAAQDVVANV
jgi:HK97 family phage portal protein